MRKLQERASEEKVQDFKWIVAKQKAEELGMINGRVDTDVTLVIAPAPIKKEDIKTEDKK